MSEDPIFDFDEVLDRRGSGSLKWDKFPSDDVLPMWVADMDFTAPPVVIEALQEAVGRGMLGYTMATESNVEAVVEHYRLRQSWTIQPEWVVWVPGLVSALSVVTQAYCDEGGAVMTSVPVYGPFVDTPRWAGRGLIAVRASQQDGYWSLDLDAMRAQITTETQLLFLCNPHNPIGRVYSRQELEAIGEFCVEHDLIICSDEIHSDLVLGEVPHTPIASLSDELARRTVTLHAASKTYNLAGLACAFAIIPDGDLRRRFQLVMRGIVPEVNALGLVATDAAFRSAEPWRQALLAYLRSNHELVRQTVSESMPGVLLSPVEATYLAWLDVRGLACDDPAELFREHGVLVSDGRFFRGNGFVRLNFGCPRRLLTQGLERMQQAIASIS